MTAHPLSKEPAVILGAVGALVEVAVEVFTSHPGQSWRALLPLLVGAAVRRFVTPVKPAD